jgi:hypothetical protein
MQFEVSHGDNVVAGSYDEAGDALHKARELVAKGASSIVIADFLGRRYNVEEFERIFVPKPPSEPRKARPPDTA